jgi:hypothetical protein
MNAEHTWQAGVFGMVVFLLGGIARMYMIVRLYGWAGWFASQRGLTERYRALVKDHRAPSWPVMVGLVCPVLGIIIMFASILFSKS